MFSIPLRFGIFVASKGEERKSEFGRIHVTFNLHPINYIVILLTRDIKTRISGLIYLKRDF